MNKARLWRTLIRFAFVAVVAVLANLGLSWLLATLGAHPDPRMSIALTGVLVLALLLYALLMAIPFVPGLEIGLSLLVMQGAAIAPLVFLATFFGLTLAFLVGRHLSDRLLYAFFDDIGLAPACRLLDRLRPLGEAERLDLVLGNLPGWLAAPLARFRYLGLALALNIPGNALIGGGGGIALVAGLSGTFRTPLILLTFALAVSPVPLMVVFFGPGILGWWN
ncbi:MAG: hypothetical protein ACE5DK_04110 [Paracoccaceae bacterium]